MKIAVATDDYSHVAGHAGQARHWLLYDSASAAPGPALVELSKGQVFHHWQDDGPHPLDGIEVIIAGSAGPSFVRRMTERGIRVLLTRERDAGRAFSAVLNGEVLPEKGFDPAMLLCKLRDLFSTH